MYYNVPYYNSGTYEYDWNDLDYDSYEGYYYSMGELVETLQRI